MASPVLTPDQVDKVSSHVAEYITCKRQRYAPHATPLSATQKETLSNFFLPNLLEGARSVVLTSERVAEPDFYPMLRGWGFRNLPAFASMSAITFSDVIVAHGPFTAGLLFHELVHVEQYRQLGVATFSALYVRGFLSGGGYEGIPLERNAYMLGARYEKNPEQPFSVAEDVSEWIKARRF